MKKIPVLAALVAIAIAAYSMSNWGGSTSIVGTKNFTTETRSVGDFTKIEVASAFEVDVTYSTEESITVEAPSNIHQYIETSVSSGTLYVQYEKNKSISTKGAVQIHIKTSKLNHFMTSGASSITLNNSLKDPKIIVESDGAASFKGEVDVENATIELSGAASINLSGTADVADIELSGASRLDDYSFKVNNLSVDLSGASSITITGLNTLKGDVSGASSLKYKGDPSVQELNTSGAAHVIQR
jgi:hypothetical protein